MGFVDAVNLLPWMVVKAFISGFVICMLANFACRVFDWPLLAKAGIPAVVLLLLLSPQIRALYFDAGSEFVGDSMTTPDALWLMMKVKFWAAVVGYGIGAFLYEKYID
jgi:hypothetical protein